MKLTPSQSAALTHIEQYAQLRKKEAQLTINHILKMTNTSLENYEKAVANLKQNAQVALHFHPDRLDAEFKSIAAALNSQGIYKSQFETFLSNGSVSAHPG